MSVTKHKLFKVSILGNEFDFDKEALRIIDEFLKAPNLVYLNHSITSLGKDLSKTAYQYKDVMLVISLVYKDLEDSPDQLTKASKKTKELVRNSIEKGESSPMPSYETQFDSKVKPKS